MQKYNFFIVALASPNFLDEPSETSFESFALGTEKKNEFSFFISLVFRNFAVKLITTKI
jgi:hypothetical protein